MEVGWRGRAGGGGSNRQRFEILRCMTYVRSPVKLVGRICLELALLCARFQASFIHKVTNINHKGLQRTANEYAGQRRIYKDLISKNNNVDILNSAKRILQC